jgi:hypothetical protein
MTDELRIIKLVTERLQRGHKSYGDLDLTDLSRDHVQEAIEEALDMAVYLAGRLLQLQDVVKTPTPVEDEKVGHCGYCRGPCKYVIRCTRER